MTNIPEDPDNIINEFLKQNNLGIPVCPFRPMHIQKLVSETEYRIYDEYQECYRENCPFFVDNQCCRIEWLDTFNS